MHSTKKLLARSRSLIAKSFASDSGSGGKGETTALYDFHQQNGGKIVNFGGFLLPVQYNDLGIAASHIHTRKNASLFDVSHMLQTEVRGKDCIDYFETICTADLQGLNKNSSTLTIFTNDNGGILDDLIVNKINDDHLYIVSNAARKEHDRRHLENALELHKKKNPSSDVTLRFYDPNERSLVALQGPRSARILSKLTSFDLSKLFFMSTAEAGVADIDCRVTRCGYTGEDGFEISVDSSRVEELARKLLEQEEVKLAGLGARDSLRLEAGLCLYGNDITTETTPIEAALTWLISKKRRERRDFPGVEVILSQISQGCRRKRVGLVCQKGPPARHGAVIVDSEGEAVGEVTSGCPSPTLGVNVAMGYVPTGLSKAGTKLGLRIRDKNYEAVVSKMPFVKAGYYVKPKK